MKKQRPTIPVFEWKLAVHLEATRKIQNQEGTPAYECKCEWCQSWSSSYMELLPNDIQEQLIRVGIQIESPTDLYQFESSEDYSSIRVIYHAVGKIISGLNQWQNNELGKALLYTEIKKNPYLSLVVFPQKQSFDPSPKLEDRDTGELIRIDFRLWMPNKSFLTPTNTAR